MNALILLSQTEQFGIFPIIMSAVTERKLIVPSVALLLLPLLPLLQPVEELAGLPPALPIANASLELVNMILAALTLPVEEPASRETAAVERVIRGKSVVMMGVVTELVYIMLAAPLH